MTLLDFVPDFILRDGFQSTVRHIASWASGFVLALLLAHNASKVDATAISEDTGTIIVALGSYAWSQWSNQTNKAKVVTAAATSSVSAANDPRVRAATAVAIAAGDIEVPHGAKFPHYFGPKS